MKPTDESWATCTWGWSSLDKNQKGTIDEATDLGNKHVGSRSAEAHKVTVTDGTVTSVLASPRRGRAN